MPASFARRALAYVFDLAVVYFLALTSLVVCVLLYGQVKYGGDPGLLKALAKAESTRTFVFWSHAAIYLSYFTLSQWYAGRTLGKRLCGIRVVEARGGDLSLSRSVGRTLGYIVSGQLTFGIGFALPLFRRDGRTLHDILSGTRVERVVLTAAPAADSAVPDNSRAA